MSDNLMPVGWYRDPTQVGEGRYWDGTSWTDTVVQGGVRIQSPMDTGQAKIPPLAGTEFVAAPAATRVTVEQRRGSPMGVIVGLVIAALLVVLIVVVVNNGDSSDDSPNPTEAPATEAPADGG